MNTKPMKPKRHRSGLKKVAQTKLYVWDCNQSIYKLDISTSINSLETPRRSSQEIKYLILLISVATILLVLGGGQVDNVDSPNQLFHLLNDYTTKPLSLRNNVGMRDIMSYIILN